MGLLRFRIHVEGLFGETVEHTEQLLNDVHCILMERCWTPVLTGGWCWCWSLSLEILDSSQVDRVITGDPW